jgi:hypothetical protein
MESKLGTQLYCCPKKLRGGRSVMEEEYGDEALYGAIEELIAQMARVDPGLIRGEAREVITETVGELLRDVGKIDPPFPRPYSR